MRLLWPRQRQLSLPPGETVHRERDHQYIDRYHYDGCADDDHDASGTDDYVDQHDYRAAYVPLSGHVWCDVERLHRRFAAANPRAGRNV